MTSLLITGGGVLSACEGRCGRRSDFLSIVLCRLLLLSLIPGATIWAGQVSTNELLPEVRLAIDMTDGSHILGVPAIDSIPVQTAYARLAIPLKLVLVARLDASTNATLDLRNGERLKGTLDLPSLKLETVFGSVVVKIAQIREAHVILTSEVTAAVEADKMLSDAQELFKKAKQLQDQGNKEGADKTWKEATERFAQFLTQHPSHPQAPKAMLLAAQGLMRTTDYADAIQLFERLLAAYPKNTDIVPEAMYWCGDANVRVKDPVKAFRLFKKLIWNFPESTWAKYARGRLSDASFNNMPETE